MPCFHCAGGAAEKLSFGYSAIVVERFGLRCTVHRLEVMGCVNRGGGGGRLHGTLGLSNSEGGWDHGHEGGGPHEQNPITAPRLCERRPGGMLWGEKHCFPLILVSHKLLTNRGGLGIREIWNG